jgi:hypothetical protein
VRRTATSFRTAPRLVFAGIALLVTTSAFGQVSPSEILNPKAKAAEQEYLPQLQSLKEEIGTSKFPYSFRVARYLNAKPSQRASLDSNGIEFVYFKHRVVLKISGLYKAAFDATQLSENERAGRTFQEAVVPILRLVARQIPPSADCDGIGFEIVYNSRDASKYYDYEGQEALTAIFSRDDAFAYANATTDAERQELLNRSEIFVNGKEFGLALGMRDPLDVQSLDRPELLEARSSTIANPARVVTVSATVASPAVSVSPSMPVSESSSAYSDAMRPDAPVEVPVNAILKDDRTRFHLEESTAPSLEVMGDHKVLHFTMRNTMPFEKSTSSIYKRAAQSFDLFLAPELRDLLKKLPEGGVFDALDFSVLNDLGAGNASLETIDYICPLNSMRSFVQNKITSQDFINQSTVLVNGVRIGLDLQLVE